MKCTKTVRFRLKNAILFYIYAVNAEIWLWLNKKIKLALFLLLLVRELSCCPYFGAKQIQ
ncbi:hypothetical protein BJN41_02850 [Acinetobacter towneri]|uniref:Uncharacterized protein n=1 Tax=Acinetobacter towneri TaxID=202956 RepID=A0A1E8E3J3_9GAMM|nr:hypothetical protein BJN41_02850 [Acinetobacter towneri]